MKNEKRRLADVGFSRSDRTKMLIKRQMLLAADRLGLVRQGVNLFCDIRRNLSRERFETVFDVGGNVGQSADRYRIEFPAARILSFEPDPRTFSILRNQFENDPRIEAFELAFGAKAGRLRFDDREDLSVLHHVAKNQQDDSLPWIAVNTVDAFCAENQIARIDFMKVDTEGHDLAVLEGSHRMLSQGQISVLLVECSMNAENTYHVGLIEMHRFLEGAGYRMLGVYEQTPEWDFSRKPNLHRANVAYVSLTAITRNAR